MKDFKNMKDTDLDKLFAESAEQSMPDFKESSWEKMAALLDETEGPKGSGWKKLLVYSGIILMLLSISYFTYRGLNTRPVSKPKSLSLGTLEEKELVNLGINKDKVDTETADIFESANSKGQREVNEVIANGNNEISLEGEIISQQKLPSNRSTDKADPLRQFAGNKSKKTGKPTVKTEFNSRPQLNLLKDNDLKDKAVEDYSREEVVMIGAETKKPRTTESLESPANRDPDSNKFGKDGESFKNASSSLIRMEPMSFKPFKSFYTSVNIKDTERVVTEAVETESMEEGFGLRIAFSPDFSVVPENSFFKIGHNWAALLEYRFNDKWSLQTGIIKSLKYYQASPAQYKWPEAWGEVPAELNQIDARCSMIDIPLNLRYDFTNTRNRWFAQAGFTSYLMLKENYDYIFASNYNDQVWKTWEGKTGFYPAGVVNFSGGVEKRIFRKMSVQIEPFFKVPIGKVGYGEVKLATAGLFISTKMPLGN